MERNNTSVTDLEISRQYLQKCLYGINAPHLMKTLEITDKETSKEKLPLIIFSNFAIVREALKNANAYESLAEEYEYILLTTLLGQEHSAQGGIAEHLDKPNFDEFTAKVAAFYLKELPPGFLKKKSWLFRAKFHLFSQNLKLRSYLISKTSKIPLNVLGAIYYIINQFADNI